jgi:8-oxo-dGTP diphosphatase
MMTIYVLAFLRRGDEILLLRRINTNFGQGLYSLVGGKVEAEEPALHAIQREVLEEVGLDVPESQFKFVHVFHRKATEGSLVALCFQADVSGMNPLNVEPEKHDDVRFFNINKLPENILHAHKHAIEYINKGISYSEHGWK